MSPSRTSFLRLEDEADRYLAYHGYASNGAHKSRARTRQTNFEQQIELLPTTPAAARPLRDYTH